MVLCLFLASVSGCFANPLGGGGAPGGNVGANFHPGLKAAKLSLTSVTPSSGPVAGGTALTLRGAGFLRDIAVFVGNSPCANVVWVSETELRCTTPAHAAANVQVTVVTTTPATASLPAAFEFVASGSAKPGLAVAAGGGVSSGAGVSLKSSAVPAGGNPYLSGPGVRLYRGVQRPVTDQAP